MHAWGIDQKIFTLEIAKDISMTRRKNIKAAKLT